MEETQTPAKKKPRGKPFPKGNTIGPGRGRKKRESAIGAGALEDMRKAYEQPPLDDDSPGVKAARKLLKENYERFIANYARLTSDARSSDLDESGSGCHKDGGENVDVGEKEEKVVELAQRLLREWTDSPERKVVSGG